MVQGSSMDLLVNIPSSQVALHDQLPHQRYVFDLFMVFCAFQQCCICHLVRTLRTWVRAAMRYVHMHQDTPDSYVYRYDKIERIRVTKA